MIRAQLPVWSPVSGRSLIAGLRESLRAHPEEILAAALADQYAARQALLCDSGTSGLTLALRSLGPEAVVALPAYGCFDLATAAVGADLRVRFYDLDPRTLAPDEPSLRSALRDGVSAVVVVHFYGIPVDVWAWQDEIRAAGAVLIDDAAQGVGAELDGQVAGSGGDLGILSFGRGKGRTGGHGGALLAGSDRGLELAKQVSIELPPFGKLGEVISFGKLVAQWIFGRPSLYGIPQLIPGMTLGETVYHSPRPPRRIGRTAAGILLAGNEASGQAVRARRLTAERIRERIAPIRDADIIQLHPKATPGWLRFPIVLSDRRIAAARSRRGRAAGIMGGYPQILPDLAALQDRALGARRAWLGASELVRGLVTLPTHRWIKARDLDRIAMTLEGAAAGV